MSNIVIRTAIIEPNDYLRKETSLVYNREYIGMYSHDPDHPMFINHIKNDTLTFDAQLRAEAEAELERYFQTTFENIEKELFSPITGSGALCGEKPLVCLVPRAKKLEYYYPEQLGFSRVLNRVLKKLPFFESGIDVIERTSNTETSHARKFSPTFTKPILDEPCISRRPGFTKMSCRISSKVRGRAIILVDDIYTPGVNIDEDAIQALYDNGASIVTLYAVAKTVKRSQNNIWYIQSIV